MVQGVVLAGVLLYARSGHRLANMIMAALVMATAAILLQQLLKGLGVFHDYPNFSLILGQFRFTWGPLFYLYALSITGSKLNYRHCWHFLPAIAFFTLNNLKFWQLDADQQRLLTTYIWNYLDSSPETEEVIWGFMGSFWRVLFEYYFHTIFFAGQSAVYCFMVLKLIRVHNKRIKQHFSSLEHMNLRWLRVLTIAFLIFLGLLFLLNRLPLILNLYDMSSPLANAYVLLLAILFYVVAISALLQPRLISGVMQAMNSEPAWGKDQEYRTASADVEDSISSNQATAEIRSSKEQDGGGKEKRKYQASRISAEDSQSYKIKLMEVIQEDELYLDAELTLPQLAEAAGLTSHQASQVLNGQMKQNFFSFVNNYRIDLAKRMLLDPDHRAMPIVDLAIEVGFKSKSSFYDAFKRTTDMTPTQFKRAMKASPATGVRGIA